VIRIVNWNWAKTTNPKSKIQNRKWSGGGLKVGLGSYMDSEDLAKRIRNTCIEAVLQAYEDAGMQGLCAEGRWEAAVDALRTVELAPLLREFEQSGR
jgi:hypothetical protein